MFLNYILVGIALTVINSNACFFTSIYGEKSIFDMTSTLCLLLPMKKIRVRYIVLLLCILFVLGDFAEVNNITHPITDAFQTFKCLGEENQK